MSIIDWHTHWLSPRALQTLSARNTAPYVRAKDDSHYEFFVNSSVLVKTLPIGPSFFDGPTRIAHLDEVGIDRQLISWPTTLGVDPALDAAASRELFGQYNDDLAALIAQYPQRLIGVAALSTSDIAWSARELERAHRELGFIGAVLPAGAFLSAKSAAAITPILEVAQKYGSHLHLHTGLAHPSVPDQWSHAPAREAGTARWLLESTAQFASAWITLALSDALDPYPDVSFQLAMLGGVLPYLAASIEARGLKEGLPSQLPRLRRVYIDTGVLGSNLGALKLAVDVLGAEHVLFGSDYPLGPSGPVLAAIRASGLAPRQIDTILGNGAQLLQRLPRAA